MGGFGGALRIVSAMPPHPGRADRHNGRRPGIDLRDPAHFRRASHIGFILGFAVAACLLLCVFAAPASAQDLSIVDAVVDSADAAATDAPATAPDTSAVAAPSEADSAPTTDETAGADTASPETAAQPADEAEEVAADPAPESTEADSTEATPIPDGSAVDAAADEIILEVIDAPADSTAETDPQLTDPSTESDEADTGVGETDETSADPEALESFEDTVDELVFAASEGDDNVLLAADGSGEEGWLSITEAWTVNGVPIADPTAPFRFRAPRVSLVVALGEGDDTLTIAATAAELTSPVVVDGGSGSDTLARRGEEDNTWVHRGHGRRRPEPLKAQAPTSFTSVESLAGGQSLDTFAVPTGRRPESVPSRAAAARAG